MLTATRKLKRYKHRILVISIIIFIIVGFVFFLCLKVKKKNEECFSKRFFYVLYLEKDTKQTVLTSLQDTVKKLGGAGEIYFYDKFYYLTASVYLIKDEALEVLKNLSQSFPNAGILNLERKKLPNSIKTKIKQNTECFRYFNFVDELILDFTEKEYLYLSGKLTQRELVSYLLEKKLNLEDIINKFIYEEEDLLMKNIYYYQNLLLLYFNNFFSTFFESTKKNSLVCEFAINSVLLSFEMVNSLLN